MHEHGLFPQEIAPKMHRWRMFSSGAPDRDHGGPSGRAETAVVNDMKSESVLPFEWNHCPQPWKSWAGQQANSLLKWRDCDRFCKFQQGTLALSTPAPQRTSTRKRVLPLECSDASHISGQKFHRKDKSGLHFGSLTKQSSAHPGMQPETRPGPRDSRSGSHPPGTMPESETAPRVHHVARQTQVR